MPNNSKLDPGYEGSGKGRARLAATLLCTDAWRPPAQEKELTLLFNSSLMCRIH